MGPTCVRGKDDPGVNLQVVILTCGVGTRLRRFTVTTTTPSAQCSRVENSAWWVVDAFLAKPIALRRGRFLLSSLWIGSAQCFVALDDIATLVIQSLEQRDVSLVVNACSSKGQSVRDRARHLLTASGVEVEIHEIEQPLTRCRRRRWRCEALPCDVWT